MVGRWSVYLETWRRHRLVLLVPVVLAVVIAAWTVVGAAKSYVSTASVWVDTGGASGSSLGNPNPASTPPAQQEQSVLLELLATKDFVTAVGSASSLQQYLAAHPTSGFGPSALLSKLGGHGALADRVASAVGAGVASTVPGPQVMDLSFSGPSPSVSRSTLSALIAQLQVWTARYSAFNGQNEAGYYQTQVTADQQALKSAQQQVQIYTAQHPAASATDPVYGSLVGVVNSAASQLAQAQSNLATARDASQSTASQDLIVRVVDTPSLPTAATKGKKTEAEGILGGLIAGIIISILITILLTRTNQQEKAAQGRGGRELAAVPATRQRGKRRA